MKFSPWSSDKTFRFFGYYNPYKHGVYLMKRYGNAHTDFIFGKNPTGSRMIVKRGCNGIIKPYSYDVTNTM